MGQWINAVFVLLWKNYQVRRRRYLLTATELVFPFFCFFILFMFKDKINSIPRSFVLDKYNIRNTEPMLLEKFQPPTRVYYYPRSNFTDSLMNIVDKQLYPTQHNRRELGRKTDAVPLASCNDYELLKGSLDKTEAIVTFEKANETQWPSQLKYTIHMNKKFYTSSIEPEVIGPHENFGTIYHEFMRLQWAIDTSFIRLLSGHEVKQRVTVQEFPFVWPMTNPSVDWVCNIASFLCWLALALPFVTVMSRVVDENISGIKGLITMIGVTDGQLYLAHYLDVVPVGLVYCVSATALLTSSSSPLLQHAPPPLLAAALLLHFHLVVLVALLTGTVVTSAQYVTSISVYMYAMLWVPLQFLPHEASGYVKALWLVLLPGSQLREFWFEVAKDEKEGGWTLFGHDGSWVSAAVCMVAMLLQIAALLVLLLFESRLCQLAHSYYRACVRKWAPSLKVQSDSAAEEVGLEPPLPELFDGHDEHKAIGIKVTDVDKVFNKQYALRGVSLDVYQGEVTVLLGHNGAGKTTLMSIVTGVLAPTRGRVSINGASTDGGVRPARHQIGMCPQRNTFVQHLSVLQHVVLFAMLKGKSLSEAREQANSLLKQLGIGDKLHNQPEQLSGGMKRRLQLACALAGDASVLVLDEPTSGLDVETRRELWDLLLSLRGSRTVLISTHFMEEADALGDRIAALHLGSLRCCASTMHLKRAVGSGYRLSFTTVGPPKEEDISSLVSAHVPGAMLKRRTFNSLTYNLPSKYTARFPKLFDDLESSRPELGIDSIGVGVSTLEEVFLKLCSDTDTTITDDMLDSGEEEPQFERQTGWRLAARQLAVLLQRQLRFIHYKKITFLIVNIVLPLVMSLTVTSISNNPVSNSDGAHEALQLTLELYPFVQPRRVLYRDRRNRSDWPALMQLMPTVSFHNTSDVEEDLLNIGKRSVKEYSQYLVGIELNETDAKVWYTTVYPHAAAVALGLASRALGGGHGALAANAPVDPRAARQLRVAQAKSAAGVVLVCSALAFTVLVSAMNSLTLVIKERASGARHIHTMAGCPPELYWLASLAAHAALYALPALLVLLLAACLADTDATFTQLDFLLAALLALALGALAWLPLSYLPTFRLDERATSLLLFLVLFAFGVAAPAVKSVIEIFDEKHPRTLTDVLLSVSASVMPPHTLMAAAVKCGNVARLNAFCRLNRDLCPKLAVAETGFDAQKCCANESPRCYLCFDDYSPLLPMLLLCAQFVFYSTLVILTERGIFNRVWDRVWNVRYSPPRHDCSDVDELARAEAVYVSKAYTLPPKQIQDMMLVANVHKNYVSLTGRSCGAVRGVSFSVKKGECFGLLGVNGAGKSTTFKMMTNDEAPTRGAIFANGYRLHESPYNYTRSLGYCPQFGGVDTFLTGEQSLALLLALRGLRDDDARSQARYWIDAVGLEQYAHRRVAQYSGGCARRLATAAALCGAAALTLLDEPSAGVDVAARRRVWAAVRRAAAARRSIVISSHSMEESEALCGRIAMMSGGRVLALGGAAELRAAHAAGHAARLKLRRRTAGQRSQQGDVTDMGDDFSQKELNQLKTAFREAFDCTLKDEHTTMLHYHINETLSYSRLFGALEALRAAFPALLEDYCVTETTLEEVFLALARHARPSAGAPHAPQAPHAPHRV